MAGWQRVGFFLCFLLLPACGLKFANVPAVVTCPRCGSRPMAAAPGASAGEAAAPAVRRRPAAAARASCPYGPRDGPLAGAWLMARPCGQVLGWCPLCRGPLRPYARVGTQMPYLACSGRHRAITCCRHEEEVPENVLEWLPRRLPYRRVHGNADSDERWGRCSHARENGTPCCATLSVRLTQSGRLCLGCTDGCPRELPFPTEALGELPWELRQFSRPAPER